MLCKEIVGQPKILTTRKFYGRYWHSLTAHAAKQNRIISGKSANTEEEERQFNTLQGVTKLTNRRPGDVITPSLVRLQAEQQMAETRQGNAVKAQESQISKYHKALPVFPNTIVHRYIVKNPKEYQAHLQSISDFLVRGEGVWWQHIASGVEFLDGPDEPNLRPQGPPLHHFRLSDLKLEEQYLKQCWEMCLDDETITIPHRVIRLYGDNGDCVQIIYTDFLKDNDEDDHGNNEHESIDDIVPATTGQQYEIESWDDDNEKQVESLELTEMENEACPVFSSVCDEDENDCESNNEAQIPNVPFLPKPGERQPLLMTSSDIQNAPSKSSSTSNTVPEYTDQPRKEITTKLCKNIAKLMGETE